MTSHEQSTISRLVRRRNELLVLLNGEQGRLLGDERAELDDIRQLLAEADQELVAIAEEDAEVHELMDDYRNPGKATYRVSQTL